MNNCIIRRFFALSLFLSVLLCTDAQVGPGGVGDQTTNVLWLRAGDISGIAGGDALDIAWPDTSGNDHDASQSTAAYRPLFISSAVNGKPAVQFDGTDDFLDDSHSYTARTAFIIYKVDATLQLNTDLGQAWGNYAEGAHIAMDARVALPQGFSFDGTPINVGKARYALDGGTYGAFVANDNNPAWTYDQWELITAEFEGNRAMTRQVIGSLFPSFPVGTHQYGGGIAEIIIYNTTLNTAQRIIIENYLSSKYNIDISGTGNDHYSYESTHPFGLAGIGREDVTNTHTAAYSSRILQVSNPGGMDADPEYLFFGHNGASIGAWTTTEAPDAGNNIRRLAREWKLEETGDLGDFTFTVDTTLLPARAAGYTKFVLLVDADGNFSSGAGVYEMSSAGTDEFFSVDNIDISSGYYIAIAAVKPTIEFSSAIQSGFEIADDTILLELNYIPLTDVDVDYFTTDGSAVAPGDYTAVVSATATIVAGTQSDSIVLDLINDVATEPDEDLTITLTNPAAGINIGTNNVVTYTIHDDDNPRKIYFSLSGSSGSEGTTPVNITVQITPSEFDPVNPTTVDFTVTGGSATGDVDYTLAGGTLVIPPLSISNTFPVTIIDDALNEPNETIVITLFNPTNSSLSGTNPIVFTYTINDNDNSPSVQFGSISSEDDESVSLVSIPVELSGISSLDVTVDYVVTGTAIIDIDHDLNDNSLTIPAGSLSGNIQFTVTDDGIIESGETVVITLQDPPTNGTLGSVTVHTYTILDNDADFGFTGPGGVGDSLINRLWLAADNITGLSDGAALSVAWPDASGNGHVACLKVLAHLAPESLSVVDEVT